MALLFILITVFIDMLGLGILIPVIPFIVRQFSESAFTVGLLSMSFALFQFFAAPILGRLSDRYGRRPLLLFSLLGSAIGYVLFGFARSLAMLFTARIVDGISGGNISIAQAYIADVTEPKNRSRNFGLVGAAFAMGFIIGPAIGGALAHYWGLSAPAYFAGALAFGNTLLGFFVLPETRPKQKRTHAPMTFRTLNPIGSVLRGMQHEHVGAVFLTIFAFNVAFSGLQSNFSLFTLARFGWGPQQNAVLFSVIGISSALTQGLIMRRVVKTFGDQSIATVGLWLQAGAYMFIAFVWAPWMVFLGSSVMALGVGITNPTLSGIVSNSVSDKEQGVTLGTLQSVAALTRIVGPLWAGFVFDWLGPGSPYWSGSIMIAIAAVLIMRARPRRYQPA